MSQSETTFWDHLEELRRFLFRIVLVVSILIIFTFLAIDFVFDQIVLAPLSSDFILYSWLNSGMDKLHMNWAKLEPYSIQLVNYELTGQFMAHISTSLMIAILVSIPLILFEFWKFIAPALHSHERKNTALLFVSSSILFYLGAIISYFILLPLSVRFLGTYEVSTFIPNQISLESYLGVFFVLLFLVGVMFELPILLYFLSKMGLINKSDLRKYRKHAFVVLLILSALITPTTDPFTMVLVALPLYLLYEFGVLVSQD